MAEQPLSLQVRGLTRHFGGVAAIDSLDLEVRRGEALAVIGPNGAGKSTLVNLIRRLHSGTPCPGASSDSGISMLVVEQNIERRLQLADRALHVGESSAA